MSASVKVAVRVRPFNERERNLDCTCIVEVAGTNTKLLGVNNKSGKDEVSDTREFAFDFSYWSHDTESPHFASQEKVYDDLGSSVVSNGLQGYNACVFAYGQTGSGKTYTMMGSQGNPGLIPRICKGLFSSMEKGRELGTTYKVEVSYLEIYNERVKDLLNPKQEKSNSQPLRVREHKKHGPYVENLSRHVVTQYTEVQDLMHKGNTHRTTAATNMNDTSSRSHAIFTLTFLQAKLQADVPLETGSKINLVDLAGSERAENTGATGKRLKEGSHINKSLVTLASVISALSEQSSKSNKKPHIPYRDSTLTFLLKDSLGGNSKTIMIATISPADVNHSESLGTLRYATRAKTILTTPTVNEDPNVKLIRELRDEITKLKDLIGEEGGGGDNGRMGDNGIGVEESAIRLALSRKEALEKELTDKWNEKWRQTRCILQEQRTLELRKADESGRGVVLDSERRHLVVFDSYVHSSGLTLYHLNEEGTSIGAAQDMDIVVEGEGMMDEHCIIRLQGEKAILQRKNGATVVVNDEEVDESVKLIHGAIIRIGVGRMFRYNDPQEAIRIRKESNRSSMNLSRISFLSRSTTDLIPAKDNSTMNSANDILRGLGERRATDDSFLRKRSDTTDFCEISTQTSNNNSTNVQSHPSTPVIPDRSFSSPDLKKKFSLTLPLEGRLESEDTSPSPSSDSTPASDTFYTATSILTPDVSDILSPMSPDPDIHQPSNSLPKPPPVRMTFTTTPFVTSPIKLLQSALPLNSPSVLGGAATSTPKHFISSNVVQESCRPKPKRDLSSETDEGNGACSESTEYSPCETLDRSDLIHVEDGLTRVNDVIQKLHGNPEAQNESTEKQQEELEKLQHHYAALENELLEDLKSKRGEVKTQVVEKEGEKIAADERIARPDQLALESVLKEERVVMLIEKEVQRRLLEKVSDLEMKKKCSLVHDGGAEGCLCECGGGGRMVRSSSPNSLRSIPVMLSPSELRPYSSLSAECAYDYGTARGLMYESRLSSDDLLSPVPLNSPVEGGFDMTCGICLTLPGFELRGTGTFAHWEYQVKVSVGDEMWTVFRRYRRFRELHLFMSHRYGVVIQDLHFPPRRIFGNNSLTVIERRRKELEIYLQQLITLCSDMEGSPLCDVAPSRRLLEKFSPFFHKGLYDGRKLHSTS